MLILKGKVVTLHKFSSKAGKNYMRVGVAGEGEYNQANTIDNGKISFKEGDEVELNVVLLGENLWIQN